jgi:hypothetical protein
MDEKRNSPIFISPEVEPTKSCCNWKKVLLGIIIFIFLVLMALGILAYFFWPRGLQVKLDSFDMKQATITIYSKNLVDYTVNNLHITVLYAGVYSLASMEKSDFVVKGQGSTTISLPTYGFNIPPPVIGHCERYTDLPLDLEITVDLKLLSWTGKKIKTKETMNLPCSIAGNALKDKYSEYF